MKKLLCGSSAAKVLLCIALILTLLLGTATAASDKEMMEAAYQAIYAELGIAKDEMVFHISGKGDAANTWNFFFIEKESKLDTDGLIEVVLDGEGAVLKVIPPRMLHLIEQVQKSHARDFYGIESLYQLKQLWLPYSEDIRAALEEEIEFRKIAYSEAGMVYQGYLSHADAVAYAVLQDLRLPGDEVVSKEAAPEAAINAIAAQPGWSKEHISMLPLYIEAYYYSDELSKLTYVFVFSRQSSAFGEYAGKSYEYFEKHYENPLFAMFGGSSASTPLYVGIRIDAATGEAIGEPDVMFPPIERHALQMIR